MKKLETLIVLLLTLYGVLGSLGIIAGKYYNIDIAVFLVFYLLIRLYYMNEVVDGDNSFRKMKVFYYIEIWEYIFLGIVLSFLRSLNYDKMYCFYYKKEIALGVFIYTLLLLIVSFSIAKGIDKWKVLFINIILLCFRVFLITGIWCRN